MDAKKVHLPEIDKIVSSSRAAVAAHREEIKYTLRLADLFFGLVETEAPQFSGKAKQLTDVLRSAMEQESIIAAAEERLAEDLNDLSARYDVLVKFYGEVNSAKSALEGAKKKVTDCEKAIEEDLAKGSPKQIKLQGELGKYKELRKQAALKLDDLYEKLISQRETFARFKIRRLHHGYKNYGDVAVRALGVEMDLLE
jgi:chromosome segregation ATPase